MKTSLGVLVATAALLLTGCGGGDSAADPDAQFVSKLDKIPGGFPADQHDDAIALAKQWCTFLEKPGTTESDAQAAMSQVVGSLHDPQMTAKMALVLGAGVQTYCPAAGARVQGR